MPRYLLQVLAASTAFNALVCAGQPQTIEKDELSRIKTVATLSTFGHKFRMAERPGPFVFQNRLSEHAIPEWKIDEEAVSIVKRVLERNGAYKVVAVTAQDAPAIDEAHQPETFSKSTNLPLIQNELRALKLPVPVDAYVVLGKHRDSRGPWGISRTLPVEGVGIFAGERTQLPLLPGETEPRDFEGPYGNRMLAPFAFFRVTVLRASDHAPVGSRIAVLEESRFLAGPVLPAKQIHSSAYKEEFQKLTEDDKRVIRQALTEVLEGSIPVTLKGLGFIIE